MHDAVPANPLLNDMRRRMRHAAEDGSCVRYGLQARGNGAVSLFHPVDAGVRLGDHVDDAIGPPVGHRAEMPVGSPHAHGSGSRLVRWRPNQLLGQNLKAAVKER
jgi:hypothetical protein